MYFCALTIVFFSIFRFNDVEKKHTSILLLNWFFLPPQNFVRNEFYFFFIFFDTCVRIQRVPLFLILFSQQFFICARRNETPGTPRAIFSVFQPSCAAQSVSEIVLPSLETRVIVKEKQRERKKSVGEEEGQIVWTKSRKYLRKLLHLFYILYTYIAT